MKGLKRQIEVIVEKTDTGFSAYSKKYPVATTGDSFDEVKTNALEALNLYFEDQKKTINLDDIKLLVDLPQFFEFYKVINLSALADEIKMNKSLLAQYAKGIKKPSEKQIDKILNGIREIGRELSRIGFNEVAKAH